MDSAASSIQQSLLDKAEQALQDQQTQLVTKLLADRPLQKVMPYQDLCASLRQTT